MLYGFRVAAFSGTIPAAWLTRGEAVAGTKGEPVRSAEGSDVIPAGGLVGLGERPDQRAVLRQDEITDLPDRRDPV